MARLSVIVRAAVLAVMVACGPTAKPVAGPVPMPVPRQGTGDSEPRTPPASRGGGGSVAEAPATAIVALETFIAAHPGDQQHVPDALLRLGSLHLDVDDPARAIAVLDRLVTDYPAYPRRDAAIYLLATARQQSGDTAVALAAFRLVASMSSTYATDAWFRIGELHFESGATADAARAYAEVLARPAAPVTQVARYKLAWSYYRAGRYADAVVAFQAVLDLNDPSELQPEALEYLALSLTEPDWDGDGKPDHAPRGSRAPTATVARVAAHLGDGLDETRRVIAEQAGDALADEVRDAEAIAVYQLLLSTPVDLVARARIQARLAAVSGRQSRP